MGLGDPYGGIFGLVNTFYLKEDAFKHLELPLKFCHHGGAWEPLLPTRLTAYSFLISDFWVDFTLWTFVVDTAKLVHVLEQAFHCTYSTIW